MERAAAYIIPLRIGGGTRIKAYEAMAMAKPVISTPIGVEGLPVRDGEHLVLAESAADFAGAVVDVLRNPERRHRLGQAARRFVEGSCSWPSAAAAFVDACRGVAAVEHPTLIDQISTRRAS
jgi:glycosyltransferase involved in cell wall biosynthesis